MAQRPTDWSAIGLTADPTPGDPERMDEVQRSLADLGRVAREIDDALDAVLDKTGDGAFVGQTADALRDKISGPLRGFVQSVADAFENSARALTTYAGVVRDQQWRADNALSQGRGLAKDDTRLTELASTARAAGTAQDEAGRTAGSALSSAARGIKQPVSDCDLFWEAFQWLAIALILPALIFGGPIALIAIGVNLAIFVKTAVDFAQGKASALDLFLSGLGMIAPTTKGLPLLKLISAGAKFTWKGIKGVGQAVANFFRGMFTGGGMHGFAFLPGLRDFASLTGNWVKSGGLWVLNSVTKLPNWAGMTFRGSGLAVINGIKAIPGLVRGLPAGLGRFGTASWNFARAELGGTKWLRLVLPVDAAEIGQYGLRGALRIGFVERGVLGKFRFGAPILGTAGRTAAAIPVPPPLHQVDALVDLPRADLAKIRLGDWSGPRGLELPHLEPGGLGLGFSRPPTFGVHSGFADQLSLAPHAVRQLDALLDTPVRELHAVRMGDWANLTVTPSGLHLDTGLGVSAHTPVGAGNLAGHAGSPGTLHLPGTLGSTHPVTPAAHLTDSLGAGTGTVHLPALQTQTVGLLHQPGTAVNGLGTVGTAGTGALHTAAPHVPAVHTADLLAPANGIHPATTVHPAVNLSPSAGVHPGGAFTPVTTAPATTVHGLGQIGSPGAQLHGAMDLLATGSPLNRADAPVFSTGGHLGEHRTQALTAHQVNIHLSEFAPPRAVTAPPAVLPGVHAPGVGAGAVTRIDEALGLLDHGGHGLTPPPVTSAVQPPAAHTPGLTAHTPPPLVQAPLVQAPPVHPSSAAAAPHGAGAAPGRLTGAQLDQLWRQQSDRVVALFGAADDPARAAKLQAWQELTLARHEFGKAERLLADLDARPGSGSRPSPVRIHAQASVDVAAQRLDESLDRLGALGVDPARMDQDLARLSADSLRERPRLLGGSGGSQAMPQLNPQPVPQVLVQAAPPPPVLLPLADGAAAGPNGWRIETTVTPGGPVHRMLDAHNVPDPLMQPVSRPGGGFDVHNAHLGSTASYDGTGRLVAEEIPLGGLDGAPTGQWVHTDFDGHGAPTHEVRDATGPLPLNVTARPTGGFDLRDPLTGGHRGFDQGGALVEEGRPLLDAGGTRVGPVLVLSHDNGTLTHTLAGPGGHRLDVLPGGAGLRVTHPVTGRSVHVDVQGRFLDEGLALGDGAGLRGARFAVPDGVGGHVLTDAAGTRLAQPVTTLPDGTVRITDAATGVSVRHGADGLRVESGLSLADAAGVRGGHFLVDGAPHRITDAAGRPNGLTADQLAGGGWRVTDPHTGVSTRYTPQGGFAEQGLALGDGAGLRGARFAVPDGTGGHVLTDAAGTRLPQPVTTLPDGTVRITDAATGASVRHGADGLRVETGLSLADAGGLRGARFAVPDGAGGHLLTDITGARLPERVVAHPGGGFRVERPPTAPGGGLRYERHGADGTLDARGQQLLDAGGVQVGHLERPVGGPAHPLAPAPHWLDGGFRPDPRRVVTADGTGFRVGDLDGGHQVFDDAGRLTDDATRLRGPGGAPVDRWVVAHTPQGGPRTLTVVDATDAPLPHLTVTERPGGVRQITDTTAGGDFVRHGADGSRLEAGTSLRGPDGNPNGTFAVVPEPNPAGVRMPGRLEDAAGTAVPHRIVTVRADGGLQVTFDRPGGPRDGEFTAYDPNGGAVTHQGVNVLDGGRRTDHQYVIDHTPAAGATWSRQPHPAAAHPAPAAGTGAFHHGRVEITGNGGRIRLLGSTYTPVEVFERRVLPGGGVLDAYRRTDTISFGDLNRRTGWAHWDDTGALAGHGTRRYDTSGFGWRDVDHRGTTVHEYRDGLQKTGGVAGHTFAVRGAGGRWTWHRFDGAGTELAHGPRTPHRDGGWTDRLADNTLVQKQYGMAHGPDKAGHFQEHTWRAGVQHTWERQSPHGKEVGKREVLTTDQGVLVTSRWSEQRPPVWVRDRLVHAGTPQGAAAHLATDTRFQTFHWNKTGGVNAGGVHAVGGVRYVAMDGALVDLGADGRFVRSTVKLHSGNTLKVGDHATPPGHPPTDPAHIPWEEPGRRGYRADLPPAPGGGANRPIWQDRFQDPAGGWVVAREGFADGSVREYRVPPQVNPATGQVNGRLDNPWVQRDAHGNLTGTHDTWSDAHGNPTRITGTGRPDSARWHWTATDHLGNVTTGNRTVFRGSDDPRLPWDDSFRDFDGAGALVRERNMLDGGRWTDSWRGTAPGGGERWFTRKYGPGGAVVDYGAGQQVRRWWNGTTRAWEDGWHAGARHFRDEFRPAGGGPALTVREVPPHLALGDGPLRVREYVPGGGAPHPAGAWKEFDHGAVVRERKPLGDGTFLEKDAWRSQWRRYDGNGRIVAQRTDSGLVWESTPGGGLRVTGNEYDFRGPLTEIRGFGRRIREANRLPWGDSVSVRVPRMQNALDGVPGLPAAAGGRVPLGEALYQPYWKVLAKKVALEFGQEFILEFGANLAVNGIVAAANHKQFTGKDALKAFANAAVGAGVKSLVSTGMHEIRGSFTGGPKSVLGNVDGGKHEFRRPNNHDKNWSNEWAGNETPTRWRGGTYDFFYNAALGGVVGWVNGSMNAAVWGVTGADGKTHVLSGMDAFLDGGIAGLAGLTTASSAALAKNAVIMGGGSRFFHRQGFGEFWLQLPFKIFEKTVTSLWLTNAYRASINPPWYRNPLPPAPGPQQGQNP
ncbi:hypothetical protein GCM10010495_67300 [Kitasatospora herbaricolor]|uniref:putative T7SS-secreted protein n=1 Tax=Kitasatospora herbaricolor TaxID=68217 RepID=UPI00174CF87E|nr:hypothetical protein [Kitasatospora herbaricolor]MDQ0306326.1 hypothetical protein [Kitasatospora herbaricolor]GGV40368.1 hypothetical protein GCM10010495_67300 [Kitasatospora herbaricolor]